MRIQLKAKLEREKTVVVPNKVYSAVYGVDHNSSVVNLKNLIAKKNQEVVALKDA